MAPWTLCDLGPAASPLWAPLLTGQSHDRMKTRQFSGPLPGPGTGRDGTDRGMTKTPPLAGVGRPSFNTKLIYLHTQRWENHPAACLYRAFESHDRAALVQREKVTCLGVGDPVLSAFAPKLPPGPGRKVPEPRRHRALSPKRRKLLFRSFIPLGDE